MNLKPVCLLLSLCYTGSAMALGLGELNVRSFLGQPLHATIALLDATADTPATCFRLEASEGGIAPPPRPQLSIQRAGDQALLHIRTPQPVNDPVAQFVLVVDCEVRLKREYAMLLDPPAGGTAAISQDAPADTPQAAAAPAIQDGGPQRQTKRKTSAKESRASVAGSSRTAAPRAQPSSAPRLVLSGKRMPLQTADAELVLRLDTNLPDLTRRRPAGLTATELSDENTALARRLAHLEAQLLALQQRNAALEAQRPRTTTANPPATDRPARWPLYLLAIGLLGSGIALVAWLLRRSRHHQPLILDDDDWTQPVEMRKTLSETVAGPQAESLSEPFPEPQRMPEIAAPLHDEGTEVKEDILDQAEVFMAHGHGDLAVHLLQEHLRDAPTESPVPWLLLLDLMHRAGDTEGYAAASAECRRYFNINLTGHPLSQDCETGLGLEAFPYLLEQLAKVWNTPDVEAFLHDLIYDDRGGTRMGFEPCAYHDILLLRAIARDTLQSTA